MAEDSRLHSELRELLAEHAAQPTDFVALFMFLNTVAGGHYEDRYTEDMIRTALKAMMENGEVVKEAAGASTYYRLRP